ncbi:uncharacterized protein KY384_006234 [Bacidia gigantensis]|uniref:uncharacterized protein n=1 Tax=Bacidia gigantensis TaxID=2732470 RepID=UPI001D044154|nr:uncharacterized protein KY384_006234 [Bacidia gigantensis]KAG8529597.1 hypothetical protein KY384_006234 [Bacidia gigantensis]
MDGEILQNGTANILPIPPPTEFPFPETSAGTSASSQPLEGSDHHHNIVKSKTEPVLHPHTPQTPGLSKISSRPRPRPPKSQLSERPVPAQRTSRFGIKRARTEHAPTALTDAIGGHSTASDSSSDDEVPEFISQPSQLSGQAPQKDQKKHIVFKGNKKQQNAENRYSRFSVGNDTYNTRGNVSKRDGRLKIDVNETSNRGYLANALGATIKHHLTRPEGKDEVKHEPTQDVHKPVLEVKRRRPDFHARVSTRVSTLSGISSETKPALKLNIVIMVIGSRGDIQPFLKIGKLLKEDYGHRVRIATHPAFKKFVEEDTKLEFFSVGGDPSELMAFMVKNPGLIPSAATVRAGEVGRRRDAMFEMFQGFWRACINATDDEPNKANLKMMADKNPFVADAIIANPPSFAHVHCAERLEIPLHLMFTFPYTPTQKFPHPLANIKNSNVDANYTNFMSYPLVEMMTWQGLGDLVNRFRVKTLGLEPVSTLWAPGQLYRQKVPYTYMWSPGLVPKPDDWGPEIDVTGFVFLDLASSFKPPDTLADFLAAGEPPVYIGFGSIVVDDPDKFTALIFEAVKKAGVRALVSKGWGGLGDEGNTPDNIYMLENTPHDWLFPRVSAVVHHGGAGTTAIGLKCGKPTMIVPFFGDQPFWGSMVGKAGAGASEPVPYKRLTSDALAEGITQCLTTGANEAAQEIAESIAKEGDGAKNAVESFERHLPSTGEHSMRCSVLPDRVAVWLLKQSNLKLSTLAAYLLVNDKKIKWEDLRLIKHHEWTDFAGPGEPVTGGGAAILNSMGGAAVAMGSVPVKWAKRIRKREKRQKQRQESTTATNSGETSTIQSVSQQDESSKPNGALQNEGQHGTEANLPAPNTITMQQQEPTNTHLGKPSRFLKPPISISPNKRKSWPSGSSATSNDTVENLACDLAGDTGTGIKEAGEALAKVPMDLSLAIAQGFHNAPRLYGDETVRTAPKVNGIKSGLRAAGLEFTLGFYDGFTGLYLQPYNGARQNGAKGFVQGVGKGLGGFVLKDISAVISPVGYAMKGVHKEIVKGRDPVVKVRKARITQGQKEYEGMGQEKEELMMARAKVDAAWRVVCELRREDEMKKQEGMKGRLEVAREQRKRGKEGGWASVGQARRGLERKREERRDREDGEGAGVREGNIGKGMGEGMGRRGSRLVKIKGVGRKGSSRRGGGKKRGYREGEAGNGAGNGGGNGGVREAEGGNTGWDSTQRRHEKKARGDVLDLKKCGKNDGHATVNGNGNASGGVSGNGGSNGNGNAIVSCHGV